MILVMYDVKVDSKTIRHGVLEQRPTVNKTLQAKTNAVFVKLRQ